MLRGRKHGASALQTYDYGHAQGNYITEGWVLYSNLELSGFPIDMLPNHTITLILSNNNISKMKNSSFSGLSFIERLLWCMQLLLVMQISMIHAAAGGLVDVCSLCCN